MLLNYQTQTSRLLSNPSGVPDKYLLADLTVYINLARNQLAAETSCVEVNVAFALTAGTQAYTLPSIPTNTQGVAQILNVQSVSRPSGNGFLYISPRPWEWFRTYNLNTTAQASGPPTQWTQYSPGVTASLYFSPVPDQNYSMVIDAICQPINLALDTDVEAIPYPYTDAVPYFAAYLALISDNHIDAANFMMDKYKEFVARGDDVSRPMTPPDLFKGRNDILMTNKLGLGHPRGPNKQKAEE